jgi:hypothetical protein
VENDPSFWQTDAEDARHRLNIVLQLRQLQGQEVHLTTRHGAEHRGRLEIVGQSHLQLLDPGRGEDALTNLAIADVILVVRA